jgi:hypothetical protein
LISRSIFTGVSHKNKPPADDMPPCKNLHCTPDASKDCVIAHETAWKKACPRLRSGPCISCLDLAQLVVSSSLARSRAWGPVEPARHQGLWYFEAARRRRQTPFLSATSPPDRGWGSPRPSSFTMSCVCVWFGPEPGCRSPSPSRFSGPDSSLGCTSQETCSPWLKHAAAAIQTLLAGMWDITTCLQPRTMTYTDALSRSSRRATPRTADGQPRPFAAARLLSVSRARVPANDAHLHGRHAAQ